MKKPRKIFDFDVNVGKCEIYLCFSPKGLPNPENLLCGSTRAGYCRPSILVSEIMIFEAGEPSNRPRTVRPAPHGRQGHLWAIQIDCRDASCRAASNSQRRPHSVDSQRRQPPALSVRNTGLQNLVTPNVQSLGRSAKPTPRPRSALL